MPLSQVSFAAFAAIVCTPPALKALAPCVTAPAGAGPGACTRKSVRSNGRQRHAAWALVCRDLVQCSDKVRFVDRVFDGQFQGVVAAHGSDDQRDEEDGCKENLLSEDGCFDGCEIHGASKCDGANATAPMEPGPGACTPLTLVYMPSRGMREAHTRDDFWGCGFESLREGDLSAPELLPSGGHTAFESWGSVMLDGYADYR